MNESCKFFQWADENVEATCNNTFQENSKKRFKKDRSEQLQNLQKRPRVVTGKRKCGICGIEGLFVYIYIYIYLCARARVRVISFFF